MLVAFSVTPLGSDSVSEDVTEAVRVVRESGLRNETNALFTNLEGDWDEVMSVVKQAVDAVAARSTRVSIVLKADLDMRAGGPHTLESTVDSVERKLNGSH